MSVNIDFPPAALSADKNNSALFDYLYHMSEQLNYALTNLDSGKVTYKAATGSNNSEQNVMDDSQEISEYSPEQIKSLKAMIINTANAISQKVTEIDGKVTDIFAVDSPNGTFSTLITKKIENTTSSTITNYSFTDIITDTQVVKDLTEFKSTSEQYIKTGYLYKDENDVKKVGVAVGEISTQVTEDDIPIIERGDLVATFTSDQLAFWYQGVKLAYFTGTSLYITNAKILDKLNIGSYVFDNSEETGLEIRWDI